MPAQLMTKPSTTEMQWIILNQKVETEEGNIGGITQDEIRFAYRIGRSNHNAIAKRSTNLTPRLPFIFAFKYFFPFRPDIVRRAFNEI
jgi:hypothetical protein